MMPVAFIDGNRVFDTDGNPYAVYLIEPHNYAFLPTHEKQQHIKTVGNAIENLIGEYHLYLLTQQPSLEQVREQMGEYSDSEYWHQHIEQSLETIKEKHPFIRKNYLVVPLKKRKYHAEDTKEFIKYLAKNAVGDAKMVLEKMKSKLIRDDVVIPIDSLNSAKRQSDDLLEKLEFGMVRSGTPKEVEWWLKKSYYRGIEDPELVIPEPFPAQTVTQSGKEVIRPVRNTVDTLSKHITPKTGHLEVRHDHQTSYQSFFVTTDVPADIDDDNPTGYEWIYGCLEWLKFPVDAAVHVRTESAAKAAQKVNRKYKIASEQVKEWSKTGREDDLDDVPEELAEDMGTVDYLQRRFRQHKKPLSYVTTFFALGANSKRELNSRKRKFKEQASKYHTMANPKADMMRLFRAFYPFQVPQIPSNWEIPMDHETLSASVPLGVRMLGDPMGVTLGELVNGRTVYLDPLNTMIKHNRTAAMLICGALGSGKTVLLKYIMYMMHEWGAYGFANDPKGDWEHFASNPKLAGHVKVISFDPESDTLFTPFRLGTNDKESYDSALGVLELIFNRENDEMRLVVLKEGLERVMNGEKRDFEEFGKHMAEIQDHHHDEEYCRNAYLILNTLKSLPQHSIGGMMCGKDDGKTFFGEKRMVIAITSGLELPSRNTEASKWTERQRYSVAMMYSIITMAWKFLKNLPSGTLKTLIWEEFWYLKKFEEGEKLYEEALRFARSFLVVVAMASQNPTDSELHNDEDDVSGLFGWRFMLRLDSKKQVEYAMNEVMDMGTGSTATWTNRFANEFYNGKGLVKDPYGRVGQMQITILDQDLMYYLKSTPEKTAKEVGEKNWSNDDQVS